MKSGKVVTVLVVEDNAMVRDLLVKGLEPHCDVVPADDGADALLKAIDSPPDIILCDYKMPGMDGRQLYDKLRGREQTRGIPFIFVASRGDIDETLRPLVDGVEDFIPKPFFLRDLVRRTKKVVDRIQLEKLSKRAARPGVIQGRLEEMGITDLLQSLEVGQKSCRLTLRRNNEACEMFFTTGQCTHAVFGTTEGEAAVFLVINWSDGEFEIDFNSSSDRATISRTTTGLLMEAFRLVDEAQRDAGES